MFKVKLVLINVTGDISLETLGLPFLKGNGVFKFDYV